MLLFGDIAERIQPDGNGKHAVHTHHRPVSVGGCQELPVLKIADGRQVDQKPNTPAPTRFQIAVEIRNQNVALYGK